MSSSAIKTYWWIGALGFLIIGVIFWGTQNTPEYEELGEKIPIMGKNHINPGDAHEPYNSNPPTSGPHAESLKWGIYEQEIADENVIHNLEHGGIWITYQDKNNQDLKNKLEALAKQYQSKILLSPRAKNDSPIALSAWGRLLKLTNFDEIKIKKFIRQYKNKGPEYIPD